jgi:hypothetical protein
MKKRDPFILAGRGSVAVFCPCPVPIFFPGKKTRNKKMKKLMVI